MLFGFRNTLRLTLTGSLLLATSLGVTVGAGAGLWLFNLFAHSAFGFLVGVLVAIAAAGSLALMLTRKLRAGLQAIERGLLNLTDNDFSATLAQSRLPELDRINQRYNQLVEQLRRARQTVYQRELLLDTVIENSSMCVLIGNHDDRIIYSNRIAQALLNGGKAVNGLPMLAVLAQQSLALAEAVTQEKTGIVRLAHNKNNGIYHVSCGRFILNSQRHRLVLIKEITREVNRQEAESWKNVIRVISHELNNSLAPISSMAHSGQLLLQKQKHAALSDVFQTIAERAEHLRGFVGRYAQIAKLPTPTKAPVDWHKFIGSLHIGYSFCLRGHLPAAPGFFDTAQLQQVLLNLLKNAAESGSDPAEITLCITQDRQRSVLEISDRGSGMQELALAGALLPFYTTKPCGSGIGLPLCREIIDAHDGQLFLSNRAGGGLRVSITLPLKR